MTTYSVRFKYNYYNFGTKYATNYTVIKVQAKSQKEAKAKARYKLGRGWTFLSVK